VKGDRELVAAVTTRMVIKPATLDVMVTTNLHADILSDLAAALSGSLGIAPTANLNPERKFPSMFEPIHGSAFDIAGKGVANPIATFWTASMMLDHLGEHDGARRLMHAIERVTASEVHTPDLGGTAKTVDVTKARRGGAAGAFPSSWTWSASPAPASPTSPGRISARTCRSAPRASCTRRRWDRRSSSFPIASLRSAATST